MTRGTAVIGGSGRFPTLAAGLCIVVSPLLRSGRGKKRWPRRGRVDERKWRCMRSLQKAGNCKVSLSNRSRWTRLPAKGTKTRPAEHDRSAVHDVEIGKYTRYGFGGDLLAVHSTITNAMPTRAASGGEEQQQQQQQRVVAERQRLGPMMRAVSTQYLVLLHRQRHAFAQLSWICDERKLGKRDRQRGTETSVLAPHGHVLAAKSGLCQMHRRQSPLRKRLAGQLQPKGQSRHRHA